MTWLKVVNKDFKKLGKADMQDRTRWKQLCCKGSAGRLLGSRSLEDERLVPA